MKDSDAESSSSLVEIKADPLEEDEEDWPTASTVTQGFKTEAADSEDETWTPSSPFPNSLEAESRDSGGAFDSAEYDLFCLQYYPPDKMPRTLECSHCNHKSQTFQVEEHIKFIFCHMYHENIRLMEGKLFIFQEKIKHQLRAHHKCKPFLCACDGATYLSCDQLRLHFVRHHDVEETANGFWKQEQLAELANMKPVSP